MFNKVGDLYLRTGKVQAGVETYERAVTIYEEGGLHNNAIALCNKILRNAPGRTPIYLKLAKLMVQRGFVAEAKQNLLEYAERMKKAGQVDDAFNALKEFADLSPDNEEIRLLLAEQLKAAARTEEAQQQLAALYHELEAKGDKQRSRSTLDKIKAIDPDFDAGAAPKPEVKEAAKPGELVFLDLDDSPAAAAEPEPAVEEPVEALDIEPTAVVEETEPAEPVEAIDLERASADYLVPDETVEAMSGLEVGGQFEGPAAGEVAELEIEPTDVGETIDEVAAEIMQRSSEGFVPAAPEPEVAPAPEPKAAPAPEPKAAPAPEAGDGELEVPDLDLSGDITAEEAAAAGTIEQPRSTGDPGFHSPQVRTLDMSAWDTPLPGAESLEIREEVAEPVAEQPAQVVPPGLDELLDQVADDPDNPDLHRSLGETLLEQGERERGVEELDIALEIYQLKEDWRAAEGLAEEILRIEPNSVRHNQNLVEFAFRRGDKERLAEAYLGLADALFRTGAAERAHAVYQRVLEHDPGNERAQLGLHTLEPAVAEEPAQAAVEQTEAPAAAAPGSDFVDLAALVLDEDVAAPVRDTRMRIEEEEPTGDEQKDFEEMLGQFKKGIEQNLDEKDWRAHYDLGIAFKEMGLLDEAISSFQKALRSQDGRLRAAEALGLCFFEKGQFAVAATVLRRGVETDRGGDDGMIGLLYWLGRCEEEQTRVSEALVHYQRVFAVDINFLDVSDRVKQLAKAGR